MLVKIPLYQRTVTGVKGTDLTFAFVEEEMYINTDNILSLNKYNGEIDGLVLWQLVLSNDSRHLIDAKHIDYLVDSMRS